METEEEYDMLDLLAYNCTNLSENLGLAKTTEETDEILRKYLEKADTETKSTPEFKEDLDWFNVTEPLTFSESLKGKIVVLDFFTYCCINCMHILPDLKKLEKKYTVEDGLVVVGVHSAKFDNEKDSANILSAVQRYDITHPVVNDSTSSMWIDLKIKCWPTLLILGPNANPIFVIMGEGHYDLLEKYVGAALKFYRGQGKLHNNSLPLNPSTELLMSPNLKFPGKITCSKWSLDSDCAELYAISDSGNHRILIINPSGDVLQKIGGKDSGFVDGDFKTARFNSPQGITFLNVHTLFVADTENHAIRKVDLKNHIVETVAGTGVQGNDRVGGKIGRAQAISSPWDVVCHKTRDMDMSFHMDESTVPEKDILLIAAAGTHQIWALFLDDVIFWKYKQYPTMSCAAIVGTGHEENRNNSYPNNASFAQPSGLALSRETKELYIADSESSCVRKISLSDGKVMPVVGGDRNPLNLFAFGDVDGKQYAAKLQHPLGVAFNPYDGHVYVADTYNHKIKQINVSQNTATTCRIIDMTGAEYQFNEPGGLCLSPNGEQLYVADTNNHTIEVINLSTMTTKQLKLNFNVKADIDRADYVLALTTLKIKPNGGKIKLSITLNCVDGAKLTEGAPQSWNVYLPSELYFVDRQNGTLKADGKIDIDITAPVSQVDSQDIVTIYCKLNLCKNNLCFSKLISLRIPVSFHNDGLDCIIEDINVYVSDSGIRV